MHISCCILSTYSRPSSMHSSLTNLGSSLCFCWPAQVERTSSYQLLSGLEGWGGGLQTEKVTRSRLINLGFVNNQWVGFWNSMTLAYIARDISTYSYHKAVKRAYGRLLFNVVEAWWANRFTTSIVLCLWFDSNFSAHESIYHSWYSGTLVACCTEYLLTAFSELEATGSEEPRIMLLFCCLHLLSYYDFQRPRSR